MKPIQYIKKSYQEMKHVVWPPKGQVWVWTLAIIMISFLTAYFVFAVDLGLKEGLKALLNGRGGAPSALDSSEYGSVELDDVFSDEATDLIEGVESVNIDGADIVEAIPEATSSN